MQSNTAARAAARLVLVAAALTLPAFCAYAEECPEHPAAIGTSRLITVDPAALHQVGTEQYAQTLPLRDHEVVLTFDDGPSPATTEKVLDALAAECVSANFFIVGEHAKERPDLVRRAILDGHTVGTHSQTHPDLAQMPLEAAEHEIDDGIDVGAGCARPARRAGSVLPCALSASDAGAGKVSGPARSDAMERRHHSARLAADHARRGCRAYAQSSASKTRGHHLVARCAAAHGCGHALLLRQLKEHGYSIVHTVPIDVGTKPLAVSGAGGADGTQ